MFINNLTEDTTEQSVRDLFSPFGTVRSVEIVADIFTRRCRGFGFVEMEGHEARAAISGLDGKLHNGKTLRVQFEKPRKKRGSRR